MQFDMSYELTSLAKMSCSTEYYSCSNSVNRLRKLNSSCLKQSGSELDAVNRKNSSCLDWVIERNMWNSQFLVAEHFADLKHGFEKLHIVQSCIYIRFR